MRIEKMPGYVLPTLAEWPSKYIEWNYDSFVMFNLKLENDGSLRWYKKYIPTEKKYARLDVYEDLNLASDVALINNETHIMIIDYLPLNQEEKSSLRLKVEKAITSRKRLLNEEILMLQEAMRRNRGSSKVDEDKLILPNVSDTYKNKVIGIMNETPYIKYLHIPGSSFIICNVGENDWSKKLAVSKKLIIQCYRERIARGFGYSGSDHWGKTKAAIRSLLLPRANDLLQLASVKLLLADAKSRGQKVLLAGNFVFWYEDNGNVGWVVKTASDSESEADGNTIWKEGKIISKNHGRIVVFPYVKESGEFVKGHTKNAPHDGKALPRHPNDYVELPFEILEDDLMIGLFGELHYE
ncbi:hypothetical protein RA180_12990 [Aeromonas salmonicida]|uniref:hypothetical protein n=1 Tax=Aeromonas salmonicida TaxID=645 RepID=UPI0027966FFD|nr:hypothetical protein [Aeromonas salmonicida]MDQ1884908.1 hypothetical protein [Aeromonas salmonicida]